MLLCTKSECSQAFATLYALCISSCNRDPSLTMSTKEEVDTDGESSMGVYDEATASTAEWLDVGSGTASLSGSGPGVYAAIAVASRETGFKSYEICKKKCPWLDGAMAQVGFEPVEFQRLAQLLGKEAAANVVALMLARKRTVDSNFDLAEVPQLPRFMQFSALAKLQLEYARSFPMSSVPEDGEYVLLQGGVASSFEEEHVCYL